MGHCDQSRITNQPKLIDVVVGKFVRLEPIGEILLQCLDFAINHRVNREFHFVGV